jgi:NNP family nitrate/nitrite transporter-like MFS transporter
MAAVSLRGPAVARLGGANRGLSLVIAVLGYSLTLWAWSLSGPFGLAPDLWSGLHGSATVLAVLASVVVGSLGRIPVGVLTDW